MIHEPTTASITLPRECTWSSGDWPQSYPRITTDWPVGGGADRIITHTAGRKAIVPIRQLHESRIARRASYFGMLGATDTEWTADDVEACLTAVEEHLDTVGGPVTCHFGVRYGDGQVYGKHPSSFLDELDDGLGRTVRKHERFMAPAGRPGGKLRQVGTCIRQTAHGWFYLEATQREATDTFDVRVGLLTDGLHTEPSNLRPFFEACGVAFPRRQRLWPHRCLTVTRSPATSLDRADDVSSAIDPGDGDSNPRLTVHGTNPVFGTHESTFDLPDALRQEVYAPISKVSTLLYNPEIARVGEAECALRELRAMEPPLPNTVLVSGSLIETTDRRPSADNDDQNVERPIPSSTNHDEIE